MATLDLGRITTFSRGAWASGVTYNLLDEVLYEGSSYVSIASTSYVSSSATRPTTASGQASYWRKIASGFAHKGNFDTATAYFLSNCLAISSSNFLTTGLAPEISFLNTDLNTAIFSVKDNLGLNTLINFKMLFVSFWVVGSLFYFNKFCIF